jgi:hypothetical protein
MAEKKQNLSDDNIVPITTGNPCKVALLAIDQSHLDEYFGDGGTESSVAILDRPPKGVYFTVMPEPTKPWQNRGFYWILEIKDRDPYFVTPDIAKIKADEDVLRPILLVRYVTMAGEEGLWPIKAEPTCTIRRRAMSWKLRLTVRLRSLARSGSALFRRRGIMRT